MYKLQIKVSAQKSLLKLPYKVRVQINEKLLKLTENPVRQDLDVKKMKGNDLYRLRSGDYRILYQKQDDILIILIVAVAHRKDVYL